jgi:hypothetical protein
MQKCAIEHPHKEFKRRIKTHTVLPSAETAALFWVLPRHRPDPDAKGRWLADPRRTARRPRHWPRHINRQPHAAGERYAKSNADSNGTKLPVRKHSLEIFNPGNSKLEFETASRKLYLIRNQWSKEISFIKVRSVAIRLAHRSTLQDYARRNLDV